MIDRRPTRVCPCVNVSEHVVKRKRKRARGKGERERKRKEERQTDRQEEE